VKLVGIEVQGDPTLLLLSGSVAPLAAAIVFCHRRIGCCKPRKSVARLFDSEAVDSVTGGYEERLGKLHALVAGWNLVHVPELEEAFAVHVTDSSCSSLLAA